MLLAVPSTDMSSCMRAIQNELRHPYQGAAFASCTLNSAKTIRGLKFFFLNLKFLEVMHSGCM